ncbi:SGNH/GDSL hydrolase family protein [Streptomyces sp. NBC_01264]|uniref:SGNH/GDSL hydrolase family protein n=1 Tax=Streptomyces sp. NBC_01264 TaxID=2903804 RepID=UPI0022524B75|nr:GDSL-type esterase/lipase family protein [Streptomyces sp. NBC_01264]MCX4784018.1 GDSL-type esterase/lipase family protein [Streptomyces sp. NBC_01264]
MTLEITLQILWLGTSIMEHRQAYSPRLTDPTNLAQVGETVRIEEHRSYGYVHNIHLALQLAHPRVAFVCHNQGQGGATSRDLARAARDLSTGTTFDIAVFGCGINDVWRAYQGRDAEAVSIDEYAEHYTTTLTVLAARARHIVCVSETPIGPIADPQTVAAMNEDLARYNQAAGQRAANAGVPFIDVWTPFTETAYALARHRSTETPMLWSDGVHLSDLGVALLTQQVEAHLRENRVVERLLPEQHQIRSDG